ncbi:MAG TPA: alpha/beta hydrolase [Tepidiformaceae bacterium]|nr:alpha/beta hydrolase [Tepidiformaceae bacterium]
MPQPTESRLHVNGLDLAVFEWPGDGTPVFFAHATGFHARCWDQVIARLPGRRCIAIDLRGHGRSDKPAPPYVWRSFGEDVAAVARQLAFDGYIAVGHSKGGHAITLAAALEPGIFSRLILIDPVIMAREMYGRAPMEEHFAARRRNHWASPGEMFERFRDRPPFNAWDPAVLRDYCDHGLLPDPDGDGYVLASPPRIEAAVYAGSAGTDIYDEIASLDIPVRVLRARTRQESGPMDMSGSPTTPDLASHFKHGEDVPVPQHSHFIPMENPALVARQILEFSP